MKLKDSPVEHTQAQHNTCNTELVSLKWRLLWLVSFENHNFNSFFEWSVFNYCSAGCFVNTVNSVIGQLMHCERSVMVAAEQDRLCRKLERRKNIIFTYQISVNCRCKAYLRLATVVKTTHKQISKSTFHEATRFQNSVLNVFGCCLKGKLDLLIMLFILYSSDL
jgi:hypothetical protein